jgi:hypothetical protein
MKCEGCPLVCETCKDETGEGFWCPAPSQEDCHLTDRDKLIIAAMIRGEAVSYETSVGVGVWVREKPGGSTFAEVLVEQPREEEL